MFPFHRRDSPQVFEYQRWKHINLSDFHTASFRAQLSYGWLWFLATIAVAVYAADTYTAVNLLAYNAWPGQIKPTIPFSASKWVFAVCILFSWVLCAYEWFRAFRIMRQGSVAKDYLDPLAVTIQSIRVYPGGRGYQRFLVFAQLTKSRKGVDYLALFSYFQFKGAIRIILAEGPRQAINALTLYSVMHADLSNNDHKNKPSVAQFASNVRVLAERQTVHATILFTMLFTLVIWVFSALSFILACIIYSTFLLHYLPDRRLSRYCRRKIDRRLRRIVDDTTAKVLERGEGKPIRKEKKKLPQATVTEIPAPPSRARLFQHSQVMTTT